MAYTVEIEDSEQTVTDDNEEGVEILIQKCKILLGL